jgi:hypothetical protein
LELTQLQKVVPAAAFNSWLAKIQLAEVEKVRARSQFYNLEEQ